MKKQAEKLINSKTENFKTTISNYTNTYIGTLKAVGSENVAIVLTTLIENIKVTI